MFGKRTALHRGVNREKGVLFDLLKPMYDVKESIVTVDSY